MQTGRITTLSRAGVFAAALAGVALAGAAAPQAAGELWLRGAGATFPAPLYKRWIETYQKDHPQVSLSYDAVGSGEGVSRFVTGSVDFAATDAAISDADLAKVAQGVVSVPATAGMIVLAYSLPGVPNGGLKLPRDVYADIFAGTITRWDDPRLVAANPDIALPRRTIAIVARMDASGTTYAFSRHLDAVSSTWRHLGLGERTLISWPGNAMLARGNEGVASRIKISEGAIGYVEYGFAKQLGVPVAALQNKAGAFVLPTQKTGQTALGEATSASAGDLRLDVVDPGSADAYPIVTYSWLLLYGEYADVQKVAALKDFVGWGLRPGQSLAGEIGYIPLPPAIATRGEDAVAAIR